MRQHWIALGAQLALEEAVDLPQDRQQNECMNGWGKDYTGLKIQTGSGLL